MHKALRSPSSASLCSAPSSFRGKAFIVLHFIMLDQSYQRSHSAKADSRIQPRPVAADSAAGRRAGEARPKGESRKRTEESLLSSGRFRLSPATGTHSPAQPSSLIQSTFTSHTGSLFLSLYAPRYCLAASAGFGRQFTKLRALSRLRRRYGSKKVPYPLVPLSPPHHQKNKR